MDLVEYANYGAAKDGGKIRMEGKEYIITAGDVVLIKWR
jgi:ribosome-binding ATPase YchF (GTP1/OBG family)